MPAIHHITKRRKVIERLDPYPHHDKWKNIIDRMIYFVAFFGILMTFPQLTKIWVEHNASGVSAISWAAYAIVASFWFMYGMMHKEKPIVVIYGIWIVLDLLIAAGTILHS